MQGSRELSSRRFKHGVLHQPPRTRRVQGSLVLAGIRYTCAELCRASSIGSSKTRVQGLDINREFTG